MTKDEVEEVLLALAGASAHMDTVSKLDPRGEVGAEARNIMDRIANMEDAVIQ